MISAVRSRLTCEVILFPVLIAFLTGCAILQTRQDIHIRIEQQFTAERFAVESSLEFLRKEPGKSWTESDTTFYSLWKAGMEQEHQGRYDVAVDLYRKAFDTPRYEMESYEVLLSIGRSLFLAGKISEARTQLKEFISNAEGELAGEVNIMWGTSEDGRKSIDKNIAFAKWLLEQNP